MDSLATITRQRTVIATIADAIVTAAAGKRLRVAVGWNSPDEDPFADQLTRALLARGLPCRCVQSKPGTGATVAVITSGAAEGTDADMCRIDIQLHTPTGDAWSDSFPPDHRPDIVLDYLDPDGPTIRHILPALLPPSGQR